MTIQEIYEESIRQLPIADKLQLVRLILDEADPEELATTTKTASLRFDELVQEAINSGPARPLTATDWHDIREELKERSPEHQVHHNA